MKFEKDVNVEILRDGKTFWLHAKKGEPVRDLCELVNKLLSNLESGKDGLAGLRGKEAFEVMK